MRGETMRNSGTPADVVRSAIRAEEEAVIFYRMMADMSSDAIARARLLDLADDESSHARSLERLLAELTGRALVEPAATGPEGQPDLLDFSGRSEREVLEFALENELRAIALYVREAERSAAADDASTAKMLRIMADAERGHAAYLRLQLERLDDGSDTRA